MSELLKGAPVATALTEQLKETCATLNAQGIVPTLAIVRVGERGDDIAYENAAVKRCEKVGIQVKKYLIPAQEAGARLLDTIREINEDAGIHGCLMFRPLEDKALENAACDLLAPEKDIDGMTIGSLGGLLSGRNYGFPPCTAQACIELLDYYNVDVSGKNAAVLGRSLVIGKPVSLLLQNRNATVTTCHTKTQDPAAICSKADILIAAAGKAAIVGNNYVNQNQIILDVGIHVKEDGSLCGDVNFAAVESSVQAITPVPGGVGSVTTAVLAKHVIKAAERTLA